eukprot:TRINITY_DN15344_c0_g3_i2.p1 TRINITY_DN15344_c0_g3~~TRINITY_DN15344_c0_g3_i2.p1  ORF type:complete len:156 (-),score=0.73 TRINITY_DN15344_c0_g3_i2:134-601(-)
MAAKKIGCLLLCLIAQGPLGVGGVQGYQSGGKGVNTPQKSVLIFFFQNIFSDVGHLPEGGRENSNVAERGEKKEEKGIKKMKSMVITQRRKFTRPPASNDKSTHKKQRYTHELLQKTRKRSEKAKLELSKAGDSRLKKKKFFVFLIAMKKTLSPE